jgi:hypothetical protein
VLESVSNELSALLPLVPAPLRELASLQPKSWVACAILALIIVFVFRSEIMQAHEVLSMSVILLACLGIVVLITVFAKRLKSRN